MLLSYPTIQIFMEQHKNILVYFRNYVIPGFIVPISIYQNNHDPTNFIIFIIY